MRKTVFQEYWQLFPFAAGGSASNAVRQTNQIANMALLEWPQNITISDDAPHEYVARMREQGLFSGGEWADFSRWHALPAGWEQMPYEEFLNARRLAMAQIIREGFERI